MFCDSELLSQKSVAPTAQWILCCIQEGNYNCQCCNFFFFRCRFPVQMKTTKKKKKNKPQQTIYSFQVFTPFICSVRRALAASTLLQDQGLGAVLHGGALLLVMSVVSNAQIYVFYIAWGISCSVYRACGFCSEGFVVHVFVLLKCFLILNTHILFSTTGLTSVGSHSSRTSNKHLTGGSWNNNFIWKNSIAYRE